MQIDTTDAQLGGFKFHVSCAGINLLFPDGFVSNKEKPSGNTCVYNIYIYIIYIYILYIYYIRVCVCSGVCLCLCVCVCVCVCVSIFRGLWGLLKPRHGPKTHPKVWRASCRSSGASVALKAGATKGKPSQRGCVCV